MHSQTRLPDRMRIVSVQDGYALLRAEGLYQAKVTLMPILNVPDAPSIYKDKLHKTVGKEDASAADAETGTPMALDAVSCGNDDEDVSSGPKPARWLWLMLEFQLLPNSCLRPPLAPPQILHLLQDLNTRMSLATDAAAYEKLRLSRQERDTMAGKQGAEREFIGDEGMSAGASRPAMSGVMSQRTGGESGGAYSSHSMSSMATRGAGMSCKAQTRAYLEDIQKHAADEATISLLTAHSILSDIAMRLVALQHVVSCF